MSDQVRHIKEKIDIASIIGSRVELKRAGKQLKGLCPFHAERSPSFYVSPEMGIYKCFGCGASGDVYSFLQNYEGMTFAEALETMAQVAGVTLERKRDDKADDQQRQLKEILSLAKEFYHYLLAKHPAGQIGREYLKSRGLSWNLVEKFELGYAPAGWTSLYRFLVGRKKFPAQLVEATGLIIPGRTGYYDRFRSRVVFPLADFRGQVVGMSGRLLAEAKSGPVEAKYINTPETAVYHKRETLYGVYQARSQIRKADQIVLVEGEFDVLSSVQAGVTQVAGIKGSALTTEHLQLINRLTRNLVLCLDADQAGDAATRKAIDLADAYGMNVAVIEIKDGKDPDDLARQTPEKWRTMVDQPISAYQFLIDSAFAKHDPATGLGKKEITKLLLPVLNSIHNRVEQAHYLEVVAKRLKLNQELLSSELERFARAEKLPAAAREVREQEGATDQLDKLERQLLGWWLQADASVREQLTARLTQLKWYNPGIAKLMTIIMKQPSPNSLQVKVLAQSLDEALGQLLGQIYLDTSTAATTGNQGPETLLERVEQLQIKKEIARLTEEIENLESLSELDEKGGVKLQRLRLEVSTLIQSLAHN